MRIGLLFRASIFCSLDHTGHVKLHIVLSEKNANDKMMQTHFTL